MRVAGIYPQRIDIDPKIQHAVSEPYGLEMILAVAKEQGHEVDLLREDGENLRAFQIKSGDTIRGDFFKGLTYFKKLSHMPDDHFYLIYGGEKNQIRDHGQVVGWKNMADAF